MSKLRMSINIKELVDKVLNSGAFKNWDKKDNYLVSCFFLNEWLVGFYSKTSGKITSFVVGEGIKIREEEDVFQKQKEVLEELNIDDVKVSLKDALVKIDLVKNEKVPDEGVTQKIIILQQKENPLWNITYTTSGFKMLNVKISAVDGEMVDFGLSNIFGLGKKD